MKKQKQYTDGIVIDVPAVTEPFEGDGDRRGHGCVVLFPLTASLFLPYEEKHELHREFFRITNIEDGKARGNEIKKLMASSYGIKILQWLKKYNPNEL